MYLSRLLIDVGDNPDRPRPARFWLRNLYRVHQRLTMAFPSKQRRERDNQFLHPYDAADFAIGQVHKPRSDNANFLFRVDVQPGANPIILVQSAIRPDWHYAFHNARYLLAAEPQCQPYNPRFYPRQRLRFRLLANPTRRATKNSRHSDGSPIAPKWIGKRIPVPPEALHEWLRCRSERAGFEVLNIAKSVPGYLYFSKNPSAGPRHRLFSVLFEGLLEVRAPEHFLNTIKAGIGPAKALGFGLLSVAPA